ncbi:MAG: hypothetical protein AB1714_05690 [Acidobacteriota bacterium]
MKQLKVLTAVTCLLGITSHLSAGTALDTRLRFKLGREHLIYESPEWNTSWPKAVWTGRRAIVVWDELPPSLEHRDLMMASTSADGVLIGNPKKVARTYGGNMPMIAWTGKSVIVAWDGPLSQGEQSYVLRIQPFSEHMVPRSSPWVLKGASNVRCRCMPSSGTQCAIIWDNQIAADAWQFGLLILDDSGKPTSKPVVLGTRNGYPSSAAWDGDHIDLVYHSNADSISQESLWLMRIDPRKATVISESRIIKSPGSASVARHGPHALYLVWDALNASSAWELKGAQLDCRTGRTTNAVRLGPYQETSAAGVTGVSDQAYQRQTPATGVAWTEGPTVGPYDVYIALATQSDRPGKQVLKVSDSNVLAMESTVVSTGTGFLVLWRDWKDGRFGGDLFTRRVYPVKPAP